jgi:uncharacterized coiled-coil protein SlyX
MPVRGRRGDAMDPGQEQRLQKLEENQAFGERVMEELGEELRSLSKRVAELAAMIQRVEGLLAEADKPEDEDSVG